MKKSIVAFIALFVCSIFLVGTGLANDEPPMGNTTRFVFGSLRDEIYLLDTQTGHVWRLLKASGKGSPDTLVPLEFICENEKKGIEPNCVKIEPPKPPKE
jgi:hypothetical protein